VSAYIALGLEREPLNQMDLRNGVDATLGGGGGTFWKPKARGHQGVPAGMGWDQSVPLGCLLGPTLAWCPIEPSHVYAMK
jgi:hypothetical protein